MASITSSFMTLKAAPSAATPTSAAVRLPPKFTLKASLKDLAITITAAAATAVLTGNAAAMQVILGSDDGGLVFVPQSFEVAAGEKIVFFNNAGYPHNVIFDEDEVPAGVDAAKISMAEEDLLNAKGDTYAVTLTEKGTYSFYCAPHQGAGMVGKVTVKYVW